MRAEFLLGAAMRKVHGPLWFYRIYYGSSHWTWRATAIVILIVGLWAGRIYEWSLGMPVCKKTGDTVASSQIGPIAERWEWRFARCPDGWTDIRSDPNRPHHD